MHDFFVDRFVHVEKLGDLLTSVRAKARAGGGGIHGVRQSDVGGGNAVNLAHALATLGARTLLITHSDPQHESLLRSPFEGLPSELRVKPLSPGLTVAFEEKRNVMLGELGGAGVFGPALLDEDDWLSLADSRVVCSVNWSANKCGTELLAELRRRLGKEKTIFADPADFRDRLGGYRNLLSATKERKLIDWLSLNEVEAVATAKLLRADAGTMAKACLGISRKLEARVDIHSPEVSYSSSGAEVVESRTKRARPKRLTGAGDAWNAGSIYAHLAGMKDDRRLEFANATARLYIESEVLRPPTEEEVLAAID